MCAAAINNGAFAARACAVASRRIRTGRALAPRVSPGSRAVTL